jgi:subtilisin family serine protease
MSKLKIMRLLTVSLLCVFQSLAPVPPALSADSQDPLLKHQWGLRMINAPGAWRVSMGEGVRVAVLDTGIDARHPDLRKNIARGGIDLLDGDRDASDDSEGHGHGTHVAGIIAARRNKVGVVGVAPLAEILPVRVCSSDCSLDAIAEGIRYAVDREANVINISIATGVLAEANGGNGTIREALVYAAEHGVVTVAAAGNQSLPICSEPAASAICVGSVNRDGNRTLYSNSDATLQENYLVAPGGDDVPSCEASILSTFPRNLENACGHKGYTAMSGTSMAAPHVTGVAALLVEQGFEGEELVERLLSTARDLGLPGRDGIYGYGLVDAWSAVAND